MSAAGAGNRNHTGCRLLSGRHTSAVLKTAAQASLQRQSQVMFYQHRGLLQSGLVYSVTMQQTPHNRYRHLGYIRSSLILL